MPKIDRLAIYARDGGLCGFCGEPVPLSLLHLDHIQPRALGGPTTAENLRVAHRRCNIRAGREVVAERRRMGLPAVNPEIRMLTVPTEMLDELNKIALGEERTLNAQIIVALREWLAEQKTKS